MLIKKLFGLTSQQKQNLSIFSLILITILLVSFVVSFYCHLFYGFGLIARERFFQSPMLAFFTTPFFFWISSYLCRKFAQNASGNTIDQIKKCIINNQNSSKNNELYKPILSYKEAFINFISSLLVSFGGGGLGKEAPSVFISTSIFVATAQRFKKKFPQINLQNWTYIGIIIGFAVPFNSIIASLIYPFERFYNQKKPVFDKILLSVASIWLCYEGQIFSSRNFNFSFARELVIIFFITIICSICANFLRDLSLFFYKIIVGIKSNLRHFMPIIIGFLAVFINFFCGNFSFNGGVKYGQELLNNSQHFLSLWQILARITNTALTFISGCAGGLVAPAIAIGGGLGLIFTQFALNLDDKVFILVGMVAFLSPILKAPLTTTFVIIEVYYKKFDIFPFLCFASIISSFMSEFIGKLKLPLQYFKWNKINFLKYYRPKL